MFSTMDSKTGAKEGAVKESQMQSETTLIEMLLLSRKEGSERI